MATKIYLPRLAQTTAISPSIDAGWNNAPALVRAQAKTTTGSDAIATVTITETDSTSRDICAAQYIAPLKAGQTITGGQAVQFVCQFQESTSNNNMNSSFGIRIMASDGTTVRKTVLAVTREANEVVASPTVHTNRNNTATSVAGNYTTVAGDFLVIEIGAGGDPSGSSPHTYSLRLGNATATFLTANDTGTSSTDNNSPWVQLADTLILEASIAGAFISSGAVMLVPTLTAPSTQTLTPPAIASGNASFAPTVAPDAVTLSPPTITSGTRFAPTVTPQSVTLTGAFISSGASLHTPLVTQSLVLQITNDGFLTSSAVLYAPFIQVPFQTIITDNWCQELLGGIDGSNVIFNLTKVPQANSLNIFINGFHQLDYTLLGSTITLGLPPNIGDVMVAVYCAKAFPTWRRDTIHGANSANAVFALPATPKPQSLLYMINGFLQSNYTRQGATITFDTAPSTGDDMTAAYFV